jgi:hypothetical protein
MPAFKTRRQHLAPGGTRVGDAENYTDISTTGRQTMAGTARVWRDVYVPAGDFLVSDTSGSMSAGSILIDVSGSIFAGVAGSMASIPVIQPSVNITGSATTAFATFPVPLDADTSGSVYAIVEWTSHDTHATAGSVFALKAGLGYLGASAAIRQAASASTTVAYGYTASGIWYSTTMPAFPSFRSTDTTGIVIVRHDQTESADTAGSGIAISGVRIKYLSNKVGASA